MLLKKIDTMSGFTTSGHYPVDESVTYWDDKTSRLILVAKIGDDQNEKYLRYGDLPWNTINVYELYTFKGSFELKEIDLTKEEEKEYFSEIEKLENPPVVYDDRWDKEWNEDRSALLESGAVEEEELGLR